MKQVLSLLLMLLTGALLTFSCDGIVLDEDEEPTAAGENNQKDEQYYQTVERMSVTEAMEWLGDTVWIDPVRRLVLPARTSPDARPIVVPGKGRSVLVTPHNARLLAWLLQTYEHSRVTLTREGGLQMAGSRITRVKTSQNYYWIETQPDSFRLVPHCELVGKIVSQF